MRPVDFLPLLQPTDQFPNKIVKCFENIKFSINLNLNFPYTIEQKIHAHNGARQNEIKHKIKHKIKQKKTIMENIG